MKRVHGYTNLYLCINIFFQTCSCPKGQKLVHGTSCREPSELESETTTVTEESQLKEHEINSAAPDNNLIKLSTKSKTDAEITTPLHQRKTTTLTTQSTSVKSYPSCQNLQYEMLITIEKRLKEISSNLSTSSDFYIFYVAFIVFIAVLGFMSGYFYRGKLPANLRMR